MSISKNETIPKCQNNSNKQHSFVLSVVISFYPYMFTVFFILSCILFLLFHQTEEYILLTFFFFFFGPYYAACQILVLPPGIKPMLPAVEVWCPNSGLPQNSPFRCFLSESLLMVNTLLENIFTSLSILIDSLAGYTRLPVVLPPAL